MSRSSLSYLRLFVLLAALLLCVGPALSIPSPKDGEDDDKHNDNKDDKDDKKDNKNVIRVKEGQSIQNAIDRAKPYVRIEVEGEHAEQLTITKDGISLIGKGARLSPPGHYDPHNFCYGLVKDDAGTTNKSAGICIHGRKIELADKYTPFDLHWKVDSVGDPVKDVRVSGFEVVGFDGPNIAVYGGKNTKVSHNKLKAGFRYGFLTAGSTGTVASENIVIGSAPATLQNGPIGMCMDDLSSAEFSYNNISNYNIALCTETSGGVNKNNDIHDCCIGNIIDPNVTHAKSIDNHIYRWNKKCPPDSAAGISLLGAKNALVQGNKIEIGFTGLAPPQGGAGLFLGLEDLFQAVNEGNTITNNWFGENDADIFDDSKGKNYISNNICDIAARGPLPGTPAPEYCIADKGHY
ncbi:hypothetical protein BU25DRAFT_411971 [Macroventuria anomochaeta]|uniref:Uncharacterized protein n=1 Tax=Macroventuria anomochaeta TaxID=301207 RepID=A0ACB6RY01_9PLEO|nr:uncharacterized protein BU25DRAFT_411971 [Macroventuria anomochaeta]KAF2626142.1 hypothetical protein BU25DRAFT_411971 [Macroventuria anomochaeta]